LRKLEELAEKENASSGKNLEKKRRREGLERKRQKLLDIFLYAIRSFYNLFICSRNHI